MNYAYEDMIGWLEVCLPYGNAKRDVYGRGSQGGGRIDDLAKHTT